MHQAAKYNFPVIRTSFPASLPVCPVLSLWSSSINYDEKNTARPKSKGNHWDGTDGWFGARIGLESRAYLSQGQTQRPQHLDRSVRFFSACLMSWLIWSMPSSTCLSCSETQARQTSPSQALRLCNQLPFFFFFGISPEFICFYTRD